jgi:peptidyl-prolyl cis-trans isomerase B (cyclophilin B)
MPLVRLGAVPVVVVLSVALRVADAGPDEPRAGGAPASAKGDVPAGFPVGVDGVVSSGEWEDAAKVPLAPGDAVLRVKQSRGTLLLGLETTRPWPNRGRFHLYVAAGEGEAAVRTHLDVEPREHDRPHAMLLDHAGTAAEAIADGAVVARFAGLETRASLEAAVSLAALHLDPKAPGPLRWIAVLTAPGLGISASTFPAGLDLRGPANVVPPDLASTSRWAVASTWVDAGGGGAYAASDWKAWSEADRELTTKGMRAHELARALLDEGGNGRDEPRKSDREIEEGILRPLREIASKEPWTAADVRAVAAGLWKENRYDEALGLLEGASSTRRDSEPKNDDWLVEGKVAFDAERFERSAAAYARLADALGPNLGAPWKARADYATGLEKALAEERARRAADAAKGDLPLALLRTSKGEIVVRLLEDEAPNSVANFVHLAEEAKAEDGTPFFAGTLFHRVIPGAFAQGGDPVSRTKGCDVAGGGGPPWRIEAEPPKRRFFRGAVGWAVDGNHRVGSQLFVATGPLPKHDKLGIPLFGTVVAGMDVADRLDACDALLEVRILRKRDHPYAPRKV